MLDQDFATAQTIKAQIATINEIQGKNAMNGALATINVSLGDFKSALTSHTELKELLGSSYDTIAATALTSINTALASLKTSLQSDFDDLGT